MPTWATILLQILAGAAKEQGKHDQAAIINNALTAVQAGRDVDATMQKFAEEWQALGAPSVATIKASRKAIQAAIG
jgi:hypothetical protein